jgi:integrase
MTGCLGLRAGAIIPLKWSDFDFDDCTVLVQRSMVHGRCADVKTEYSRDRVPLDPALMEVLLAHYQNYHRTAEDWLFANPKTDRPYHQDRT